MENFNLSKNCPDCNRIQMYSSMDSFRNAVKKNTRCSSCNNKGKRNPNFGKITSEETKKKLSKSLSGEKNRFSFLKGNIPWNIGKKNCFSEETKNKISSSIKGRKLSSETKYKCRLSAIKRIEKQGIVRAFNQKACIFIDELNKEKGWNFQHAKNGGEVELYGYFVDGYDKEKNIIFEYDESHHYQINGELKHKDLVRQETIINEIEPKSFIRYDEKNKKLYDVITNNII